MKNNISLIIFICLTALCFSSCGQGVAKDISSSKSASQTTVSESCETPWYENVDTKSKTISERNTLAVETDEYVYYVSNTGINKYTKSDKTDKQIVTGDDIEGLSEYDGFIYYFDLDEIKCINPKSDEVSHIWDWSKVSATERKKYVQSINGFWLYQDYLYVMDSYTSAVRTNLKTGDFEDFCRDFSKITFIGNKCYYVPHSSRTFSIYEMDINTKKVELLLGDDYYEQALNDPNKKYYTLVRAVGDDLYYSMRYDDFGTYLYSSDGNDSYVIPADDLTIVPYYNSEYFYYYDQNDGLYELYEYSLKEKISKQIATNDGLFVDLILTESYVLFRPYEDSKMICLAK